MEEVVSSVYLSIVTVLISKNLATVENRSLIEMDNVTA